MKPVYLLIIGFLFALQASAQPFVMQADSLRNRLKSSRADTSRVHLLLELGHLHIFKLSELTSDLDTALLLSRQAYALSSSLGYPKGQGLSYLTASQAYREKKELQKGQHCTQRAIELLTKHGSLVDQADAYIEQAAYYTVSEKGLEVEIRQYDQIIALLQRTGNKLKLAEALKHRGDLYQLKSNNEQALKDLRQALALYQSTGYTRLHELYDLLGYVSGKMGDYDTGVQYGLLAMKTAESLNDSVLLVTIYNRLGVTYKTLNQPEKALLYFNKSIYIAQKQYYKNTIILLAITISDVLTVYNRVNKTLRDKEVRLIKEALVHLQDVVRKRPADKDDIDCRMAVASCYVNLYGTLNHDPAQTQPYCDELEEMLTLELGPDYQIYMYTILIPYYVNSKQYRKAGEHLARNEQLCRQKLYAKELSTNHLWWFKLDSAQANFPSAIGHYQRYKVLNDSLFNETKNQKIEQLEVHYRTKEKELNIEKLTRRNDTQRSELKKAGVMQKLTIVGAILLALVLGLVYNRYRLKQRNNQLLEAKQVEINHKNQSLEKLLSDKDHLLEEREWMLKEIHHRVKNNLQIITSLLHSQGVYLKDEAALSAIRESQNRVHSIALIHQKLYQSDRLATIPMAEYIVEIVDYLITTFDRSDTIRKQITVPPIELDINLAIPLGLIINEIVTNSLKYAFPANQRGTIRIEFTKLDSQTYLLMSSDDGVGLPTALNLEKSRTLGMSLIRGLSKQLGGTLQIGQNNGVQISLTFTDEKIGSEELARA